MTSVILNRWFLDFIPIISSATTSNLSFVIRPSKTSMESSQIGPTRSRASAVLTSNMVISDPLSNEANVSIFFPSSAGRRQLKTLHAAWCFELSLLQSNSKFVLGCSLESCLCSDCVWRRGWCRNPKHQWRNLVSRHRSEILNFLNL